MAILLESVIDGKYQPFTFKKLDDAIERGLEIAKIIGLDIDFNPLLNGSCSAYAKYNGYHDGVSIRLNFNIADFNYLQQLAN